MKINLNKKGFTLVELLAVIVVLAIIMLVVANRVGDAMKSSRGNSIVLQAQSIQKEMNQYCILNNVVSESNIDTKLPTENSFELTYVKDSLTEENGLAKFKVKAEKRSKFANIKYPEGTMPSGIDFDKVNGKELEPILIITLDCPTE